MAVKSNFEKLDSRMGDILSAFNDIKIKGRQLQTSLETNESFTKYGAAYTMKPILEDYMVICSKLYNNALTTVSDEIQALITLNDVFYNRGKDLGDDFDWTVWSGMNNGLSLVNFLTRIHSFRTDANNGKCLFCSSETANKINMIMNSISSLGSGPDFVKAAQDLVGATYNYSTPAVVNSTSYRDAMTAAITAFEAVNPVCATQMTSILTHILEASFYPSEHGKSVNTELSLAIEKCVVMLKDYFGASLTSEIYQRIEPLIDSCVLETNLPALNLSLLLKKEGLEAKAIAAKDKLLEISENLTEDDIDEGLITRMEAKTEAVTFLKILLNLSEMITEVSVIDSIPLYTGTFNLQQICLEEAQPHLISFYEIEYPILEDYSDANPWIVAYLSYLGTISAESKDLLGFDRAIFIASGLVEEIYRLLTKSGSSIHKDAPAEVAFLTSEAYYPAVALLNKLKKYHEEGTGYIYQEQGDYAPFIKIPDSVSQPYIYNLSSDSLSDSTSLFMVEVDLGKPKTSLVGLYIYDSEGNKVAPIGSVGGKGQILYLDKSVLNLLKGTTPSGNNSTYSLVAEFKDSTVSSKEDFVFEVTGAIPDTNPPEFTSAPTLNETYSTDTSARIDFKLDESCVVFYTLSKLEDPDVLPTTPKPLDVIGGVNADGTTEGIIKATSISVSQAHITQNIPTYISLNNLDPVTNYVLQMVAVDRYNHNQKDVTTFVFATTDDVYAPVLDSLKPVVNTSIPDTELRFSVTFKENATVYAMLISPTDSIGPETFEQVKNGVDKNNDSSNVKGTTNFKVVKDTAKTIVFTGLEQANDYALYIAAIDDKGNTTSVISTLGSTNVDTTPPVLSMFEVANRGLTTLKAEVSIDEPGILYYAIRPYTDTTLTLTADEVVSEGNYVTLSNGDIETLEFEDLQHNTPYAFWYVTEDSYHNRMDEAGRAINSATPPSEVFMTRDYSKITEFGYTNGTSITDSQVSYDMKFNVSQPKEIRWYAFTKTDYVNILKETVTMEHIQSGIFTVDGNTAYSVSENKLINNEDIVKDVPITIVVNHLEPETEYVIVFALCDAEGIWPPTSDYIKIDTIKTVAAIPESD